jgi:hypothetical protein
VRIVGAGLGRTGTNSLRVALGQLLGAPCYHMFEVFNRPDDIAVWQRAIDGDPPDWRDFFAGFGAAVDWPVAAFWREISDAFPDAPVLLSTRRDADEWWASASATIFNLPPVDPDAGTERSAHRRMALDMLSKRFTPGWTDAETAKRAYEAHNAEVRASVAPERLIDWRPSDGWGPLCVALGVPVPDEPFPLTNTTEEFRAQLRARRAE